VTLSETLDTFEIVIADIGDDAEHDDSRPEPKLAAAPFFVEFDEPVRLDPERSGLAWELPPAVSRAIELRSPFVALLLHLLPLLGLVIWPLMMVEPPAPIPVQLVFEPPPPPPPPPVQQPQPTPPPPKFEVPPRGPLSSVDQGVVKPANLGRAADPVPQPAAGPQRQTPSEAQTQTAAVPPVPQPKPKPMPPKEPAFHLPKPSGAQFQRQDETPHEAPHSARYAGSAASRDEYLAYLVTLTRQHMNLLTPVIGDRRGEAVISVIVYEDGAIGPLSVIHGSGYADIDRRIEDMIAAVGKFPPLPQWYQGNAVQLELTLKFPEALTQ